MLDHIAQALLENPVKRQCDIGGKFTRNAVVCEPYVDSLTSGEFNAERFHGRYQPKIIDNRRMQLIGNSAEILRQFGHSPVERFQVFEKLDRYGPGIPLDTLDIQFEQ